MDDLALSPRKASLEYRIRMDGAGNIVGESLHNALGVELGIALQPGEHVDIFAYTRRLASLDPELPRRIERPIRRLLEAREEFALHGDFRLGARARHLHISGRAVLLFDGGLQFTLHFLDDTQHTHLRRSYEYMFRLANHELKSPLACIMGAAEHAEEHLDANRPEGIRTCLAMIHRNADSMHEMILRYLSLSRIESGEMTPHPHDVLLSDEVLNPLLSEIQPALHAKGMRIQLAWPGLSREPELFADPEFLGIVVRNLVVNALNYGTRGTIIQIEIEPIEEAIEIRVTNEGPSLAQEQIDRLFQKFVRLDATQGSRGAGLGLYNARKLVEAWGGTIRAESGGGATTFAFTVPEG